MAPRPSSRSTRKPPSVVPAATSMLMAAADLLRVQRGAASPLDVVDRSAFPSAAGSARTIVLLRRAACKRREVRPLGPVTRMRHGASDVLRPFATHGAG